MDNSEACLSCLRSGQACTFNFAATQQARVQKKRGPRNESRSTVAESLSPGLPPCRSISNQENCSRIKDDGFEVFLNGPDNASDSIIDGFGHDDMMLNHIMAEWAHLIGENSDDKPASPAADTNETTSHSKNHLQYPLHRNANTSLTLWKGSPIHLLNSSVASQLLNMSLGEVYNSMMSGITTRYLDYNCNLFAGPYKYTFESEDLGQPMALTNVGSSASTGGAAVSISNTRGTYLPPWRKSNRNFRPETLENHTFSPEQVGSQINRVTMIGVARFLDNFGPLYGNPIDRETREKDEQTLTAVLQAFALQFAPSDPRSDPLKSNLTPSQHSQFSSSIRNPASNNAQVYTAAWHHAYQNLLNTNNNKTFVRIYAVFLFQMTVVPWECPVSEDAEGTPLGFLDIALSQMTDLQRLVEAYSKDLKVESLYRFLLDSSLAIFRWYGIVRDSIASMLYDRDCFMEEPPIRIRGELNASPIPFTNYRPLTLNILDIDSQRAEVMAEQWQQPSVFEQHVASTCQNAAGDLFHMLRELTHLKQFIARATPTTDNAILVARVETAIKRTEGYDSTYRPWLEQCIIMFYRLSDKSKLATGKWIREILVFFLD